MTCAYDNSHDFLQSKILRFCHDWSTLAVTHWLVTLTTNNSASCRLFASRIGSVYGAHGKHNGDWPSLLTDLKSDNKEKSFKNYKAENAQAQQIFRKIHFLFSYSFSWQIRCEKVFQPAGRHRWQCSAQSTVKTVCLSCRHTKCRLLWLLWSCWVVWERPPG